MKYVGAVAVLALVSCQSKPPPPTLPAVDVSRFEPAVREAVSQAMREAQAAPSDAAKVAALGMVLHAHDQLGAAATAYRRALALDPSNAGTSYFLGVVLSAEGKYAEAREPLEKAGKGPAARLKLADALLAAGDAATAQREYRALGDTAQAHYGLGRTLSGAQAAAEFARALELFPRFGSAQFALAASYRREGRAAEATRLLINYDRDKTVVPPIEDPAMERIYALSASSTGLLRKAQILEREGQLAESTAVHEQVVAADPKLDQAWVNLISLYARTGQPAKAEAAYKRAIELAPNRADAYYNFGVLCFGAQRYAEAGRAFRKTLELDPRNAEAAHNLGAVVEMSGNLNQAAELFRQAIALKPDHRLAHFHLGRIYANQRRFDLAVTEFEQIVEPLDDQSPTYLYALAATHARAGHRQQAVALLTRARSEASARGQQQVLASIERDLGALSR